MKLNEIKCDNCDKNSKFKCKDLSVTANSTVNDEINDTTNSNKHDQDFEPVYESGEYSKNQQIVAKCFDCNYYLCSNCLLDHQLNSAFANHQLIPLNNESFFSKESSSQKNALQTSDCKKSSAAAAPFQPMSNLAQLQLQYNNLEDQILIKRRQQQQQQQAQQQILINNHHQQQHQQMLQQNKLIQIENEIQKSYNFYIQMLKERRDYLINELNTIVQYALLSHTQNYNKQLKLKTELEQKRQSLEIAEAVASALSNTTQNDSMMSSESKLLNDSLNSGYSNGKMRDSNNNKISAGLAEINNLQMLNNQVLLQLKQSNPLNSIEFVSNYSAIQTSIRNTFGYIRIRDTNSKETPLNVSSATNGSNCVQTSISDYLTALNKKVPNQPQFQQNELKVLTDFESSSNGTGSANQNFYSNKLFNGNNNINDYFKANNINVLSSSSSDSSKSSTSTSSLISSMSSTSSLSSMNVLQPVKEQQQQQPSFSDYNYSSPISAQTSNSHIYTNPSSGNNINANNASYLLDQFPSSGYPKSASKIDWPSSSNNGLSQLLSSNKLSSKQLENDLNHLILTEGGNQLSLNESTDFLFNSNGVFNNSSNGNKFALNNKGGWPTSLGTNEVENNNENIKNDDEINQNSKTDVENFIYSSFLLNAALDQQNQQQLQQQEIAVSPYTGIKDQNKMNGSKLNGSAITLSASSSKSSASSSSSSYMSKLNGQQNIHDDNLMLLSNQQLLATPEDRSSSSSSPSSDINYQDANLDSIKVSDKYSSNLGNSLGTKNLVVGSSSISSSASSSSSSSSRSQLRRSKMIYHCKFGEFGITDGQFTEPSGVTINTNNDIIVADTNSHRIQIFDKDGRFKFKFGECGKRDGQLLYPNRVSVVKQTGDIVVTERSPTHQIQIYNKFGQFLRKFGANILQHPRGVCVDSKGRIIVVECKVMRVLIFDLMGNVLQKFNCSKYLEFPNGVCCSNTNDREEIYISDNRAHCIKVFDYNGNFVRQIGGEGITNYPIGVGINSNNEILVADNHNNFNLTVFTQDGQLINALESKVKHAQCFDVGLMDDGSIVLASKDYRIYVYKYLNNNFNLSTSICQAETQLLSNSNENEPNESNIVSTITNNTNSQSNEANLYDLFSSSHSDLSNYNQLVGHLTSMANFNFNTSFTKSKSSDNLIDSFNSINCHI